VQLGWKINPSFNLSASPDQSLNIGCEINKKFLEVAHPWSTTYLHNFLKTPPVLSNDDVQLFPLIRKVNEECWVIASPKNEKGEFYSPTESTQIDLAAYAAITGQDIDSVLTPNLDTAFEDDTFSKYPFTVKPEQQKLYGTLKGMVRYNHMRSNEHPVPVHSATWKERTIDKYPILARVLS